MFCSEPLISATSTLFCCLKAAAGIEKKAKARRVPNFMAATASSKNQESEERVTYVDPKESAAAKAKAALLKLRGIEGKQLRDVKAASRRFSHAGV